MGELVVGVDGSAEARRALEWTLAEARTRGASVRVVHAYPQSQDGAESDSARREAELIAKAEVAEAGAEGVAVVAEALPGQPVRVLLEVSREADLLVVGSRGRHGFPGLLLGSVSAQIAHHSVCPVVIVPSPRAPR